MEYPKMLRHQRLVGAKFRGAAGEHAAPSVENDRVIGNFKRQLAVLFDQNDGLSLQVRDIRRVQVS
jgi:hypothetical protein